MSLTGESKITVYMPTIGNRDIRPAIESVITQDYANLEFIIVDDSADGISLKTLTDLKNIDRRIKLIRNTHCKGASGARNCAIMAATGYFITGIDDDDQMLPGRLRVMAEAWQNKYALVFCGHYRRLDSKDQPVPIPSSLISPDRIMHRNIIGNQIFTRLDYIKSAGLFDETLPAYQDFDMWVRLMRQFGYAKGVRKLNYIFDQTGDDRISKSRANRKAAWLKFVTKHRPWLTNKHRQSLTLLFYKEQWKQPSAKRLVAFTNCANWRLTALFVRRRVLGR